MKTYIKKLVSLNPNEYKYISLEKALDDYDKYITYWVDAFEEKRARGYPKSFSSWCETEI